MQLVLTSFRGWHDYRTSIDSTVVLHLLTIDMFWRRRIALKGKKA